MGDGEERRKWELADGSWEMGQVAGFVSAVLRVLGVFALRWRQFNAET